MGVASGCVECRRLPAGATARSLLRFDDTSRRLVVALKRGGPPTARWLGVVLASLILEPVDSVCWIPGGHDSRQRGFDHARRLAAGVAYGLSAPLRGLVTRQTEGVRQSTLSALARAENAADKFHVAGPVPHSVVLVDDVWTTGSTVSVVSRQLLDRGAQRVTVLTLARTLRESRGALR